MANCRFRRTAVAFSQMPPSIDDIATQARQGSVAAIIQILNDKLASDGIRTRAVFDQGVLQLLCEAATVDQLDQPIVVERVRQILEHISPHNVSKVNVNSRIVREQQLLWLDEIKQDPEGQLLWSELLLLQRPNFFKRLMTSRRSRSRRSTVPGAPSVRRSRQQRHSVWLRSLVGGASLVLFLALIGWGARDWFTQRGDSNTATEPPPETDQPAEPAPQVDPFVQAVRIAEQAARDGQAATSATEWLDLANRWQRASDLMAQVQEDDDRYPTAQARVESYQANSELALAQFSRIREQQPTNDDVPEAPDEAPES